MVSFTPELWVRVTSATRTWRRTFFLFPLFFSFLFLPPPRTGLRSLGLTHSSGSIPVSPSTPFPGRDLQTSPTLRTESPSFLRDGDSIGGRDPGSRALNKFGLFIHSPVLRTQGSYPLTASSRLHWGPDWKNVECPSNLEREKLQPVLGRRSRLCLKEVSKADMD